MAMLQLNEICVFYGEAPILSGISFEVNAGEVVAIVGSNGAGKTTTLKTVSGLLHPRSGEITFFGKRIDRASPYKIVGEGIAHVMEGRKLFPDMTVLENLEMGAYNSLAWKKKGQTLEWIYELFPILEERKKQSAVTLSGGEQQMLAIGRGLMSKPKLLMLDEPSLGLAPKLVSLVFDIIGTVNKAGVSVLLVEQNVPQALGLANRAYVLENGKIVLEGMGKQLLENPRIKKAYLGM